MFGEVGELKKSEILKFLMQKLKSEDEAEKTIWAAVLNEQKY